MTHKIFCSFTIQEHLHSDPAFNTFTHTRDARLQHSNTNYTEMWYFHPTRCNKLTSLWFNVHLMWLGVYIIPYYVQNTNILMCFPFGTVNLSEIDFWPGKGPIRIATKILAFLVSLIAYTVNQWGDTLRTGCWYWVIQVKRKVECIRCRHRPTSIWWASLPSRYFA